MSHAQDDNMAGMVATSGGSSGSGAVPAEVPGGSAEGGNAGAAAAGAPPSSSAFLLIPELPAPEPTYSRLPDDEIRYDFEGQLSEDGSLWLGGLSYFYTRHAGQTRLEWGSNMAYWTAETGTQPWPLPSALGGHCILADGSAVLGIAQKEDTEIVFRWTPAEGVEQLAELELSFLQLSGCSPTGASAVWSYNGLSSDPVAHKSVAWRKGDDVVPIGGPLSAATRLSAVFTADGSAAFVRGTQDLERGPSYVYELPASGEEIREPDGFTDCEVVRAPGYSFLSSSEAPLSSADGSVFLGVCLSDVPIAVGRSARTVRATRVDPSWQLLSSDIGDPIWMNENATTIIGIKRIPDSATGMEANELLRWRDGALEVLLTRPPSFGLATRVAQDGQVVFLNESVDVYGQQQVARRWTEATGLIALDRLPGDPWSRITAFTPDGSLAVGSTYSDPERAHAVLWDEAGVRDISAELRELGAEIRDDDVFEVERVWAETPIRLMGTLQPRGTGYDYRRIWLAELPAR
jgi:hypothetical protein